MGITMDDINMLEKTMVASMPEDLRKLLERYRMKKFRVLHYRSTIDGNMVDNAIGFWTKVVNLWDWKTWFLPSYSHSEIWVPDENGNFSVLYADEEYGGYIEYFVGTCYSSTMGQIRTEGAQVSGTRRLLASVVLKHPERWDYTEFETYSDVDFRELINWMNSSVDRNRGYAKRDISKFFPIIRHLVKQDPQRYICSEFVFSACIMSDVIEDYPKVISPLRLARKMPWIRNLVTDKLVRGK